jgi:hypothetical protein
LEKLMTRMIKTALAGIGVLIFLSGVFTSIHRNNIDSALLLFQLKGFQNEIPWFWAWLQCPESMGIDESRQITAIIRDRESRASTYEVYLHGSGFDISPSEPVEVNIPEGEEVELSWIINAKAMGVQSLGIPVNSWDEAKCFIIVRDEPWMDFQVGRILSMFCLLIGTVLVTPWNGLRLIRFTKRFGLSLLPSIIFIALITRITHPVDRPNYLFWLTLLFAVPLVLIWHLSTWRPECGIIRLKGKEFSLGFVIFTYLYFSWIMTQIIRIDPNLGMNAISIPSIYLNPVLLILIPSVIMLFLYPRIESTWDLPWDEIPFVEKSIRVGIYMFACPITLVCFIMTLSECLLVFFK